MASPRSVSSSPSAPATTAATYGVPTMTGFGTSIPYGSNNTGRPTPAGFASHEHPVGAPAHTPYTTFPAHANPQMLQMPPAAMFSPAPAPHFPHVAYPNQGGYWSPGPNSQPLSGFQGMGAAPQISYMGNPTASNFQMAPASYHDANPMLNNIATLAPRPHHAMAQNPVATSTGPASTVAAPVPHPLPVITTADDLKPLLRERLPKDQPGSVYKGYIRGAADFAQQSRLYKSLSSKGPGSAADFPQDDAALEVLAKGLADAMTSMANAVETGKKSVTRMHQLSVYEFELKSWELLFNLRDVQLGTVDMNRWGAEWEFESFDTFMERYEDVKAKLGMSKSLVSSLFDQEFGIRLALAPGSELKKKLANSKNNSRRAIELAEIRDEKKRSLKASQEGEEDEEDEEAAGSGDSRPAKRSRSREVAAPLEPPTAGTAYQLLTQADYEVGFDENEDFDGGFYE